MEARTVAWVAYVPVPGAFLVPLYGCPGERLARFHAKQGGLLVVVWFILLALLGFLVRGVGPNPALATLSALVLVGGAIGMGVGIVAAARGRFTRIRPVWDVLAAFSAAAPRRSPPA